MSEEFVKPQCVHIDAERVYETCIEDLIKHLCDDETLCPVCKGLGIIRRDNPYGLSNDPDKKVGTFPYLHESFQTCPNCYNGVVKVCPHCQRAVPRGTLPRGCGCDGAYRERQREWVARNKQIFEDAVHHAADSAYVQSMEMFTDDDEHYWAYLYDAMEELNDRAESAEKRPAYIWCTRRHELTMNAEEIVYGIVGNSSSFHDNAWEDMSKGSLKDLQQAMDTFCEINPCTTYFADYNNAVILDWEAWDRRFEG